MVAVRLDSRRVDKPWGRRDLPTMFGGVADNPVGEIWFVTPQGTPAPILVKYIFTSEKLSVQVHPDDAQARAAVLPSGKSECWLILDAEPGAVLGLGLTHSVTPQELRHAALDGTIEALLDWKPVRAGDFYYVPAGTIHAIGAGLTLVEVQQNADITYRLYDYGRPRTLHLDEGLAVARPAPYRRPPLTVVAGHDVALLGPGDAPFLLSQCHGDAGTSRSIGGGAGLNWFVPLDGHGTLDGAEWQPGECWLVDGATRLDCTGAGRWLIAAVPPA